MGTRAEWDALTEKEKEQYLAYLNTRKSLRNFRVRLGSEDIPEEDLDYWFDGIRYDLDKWVEQKWVAEVDLVMETRIDCEPARLAAA